MKWVLVLYFMTASAWQSAETIGMYKVGWSSVTYKTYQECATRARMFNDDPEYRNKIKAKCERVKK